MKRRKKWIIIAIVGVLAFLVIFNAARKVKKGKGKPEVVRIEEVSRGKLIERVSAPGEIEPKTNVQISAKVSARIIEMPFDEGDVVTSGDPCADPPVPASLLLKLDAKDLESQLKLAEASRSAQEAQIEVEKSRIEASKENLSSLGASLEQAQKDLERKKGLFESKDISKADFDLVKYKVDELKGQYGSAKHNLDASQKNLVVMNHNLEAAEARISEAREAMSYTTITSPINGIVTRVNAKVGEMVMTGTMNNPGTVIIEVSDVSRMLVVAQVDEADVGGLKAGQKAEVSVQAYPDIKFGGVVDKIALKHRLSDNRTKYYRTEIILDDDPNVSKLYTGLTADVDIETRNHDGVIKVPSQAVLAREVDGLPLEIREKSVELDKNKKFAPVVYRVIDDKTVVTPVITGQADLTHTIVLSGLKEGDRIIVGPYKALEGLQHDRKVQDEKEAEAQKKEKEKKVKGKQEKGKSQKDSNDINDVNEPAGK